MCSVFLVFELCEERKAFDAVLLSAEYLTYELVALDAVGADEELVVEAELGE